MTRKKQSHLPTFLWRQPKVSRSSSVIALWWAIASGICWQQGGKVRWASGCYRVDMEKRSCTAPAHFGFILTLKTCCCTWNSLAFQDSKDVKHANGPDSDACQLIEKLGWVVGVEPTTSRATVWRSATELYPP